MSEKSKPSALASFPFSEYIKKPVVDIATGPTCHPGDDPSAELNGSATPANPLTTKPPDNACRLPEDEQNVLFTQGPGVLKSYQQGMALHADRQREVVEANRVYNATRQIPQTKNHFARIEITEGRLMDQAERMDALLKEKGWKFPDLDPDTVRHVDYSAYLTVEEFRAETIKRMKAEQNECGGDIKCQVDVEFKYGGPKYKESEQASCRQMVRDIEEHMESMKNTGPASVGAKVLGEAVCGPVGSLIGGDKGAEFGKQLCQVAGGIGDVVVGMKAGRAQVVQLEPEAPAQITNKSARSGGSSGGPPEAPAKTIEASPPPMPKPPTKTVEASPPPMPNAPAKTIEASPPPMPKSPAKTIEASPTTTPKQPAPPADPRADTQPVRDTVRNPATQVGNPPPPARNRPPSTGPAPETAPAPGRPVAQIKRMKIDEVIKELENGNKRVHPGAVGSDNAFWNNVLRQEGQHPPAYRIADQQIIVDPLELTPEQKLIFKKYLGWEVD